jgi:subtilisin family serine protease
VFLLTIPRNTESDEWFMQLEQKTHSFMNSIKVGEVKIAILDTGIDLQHPQFSERIPSRNCWDFINNTEEICDEVGHGTHTASLLVKTAPQAQIFCGRVWKARSEKDNTRNLIADV